MECLGIVYCLTNAAMPDYIKIGQTVDLEQRLRQLDNTSGSELPGPRRLGVRRLQPQGPGIVRYHRQEVSTLLDAN